jgi:hypothetical protein
MKKQNFSELVSFSMLVSRYLLLIPFSKFLLNPIYRFIETIKVFEAQADNEKFKVKADLIDLKCPLKEHFDVIIVGSGPSGLISTCAALKAGKEVLVIERGLPYINIGIEHTVKKSSIFLHEQGLTPVLSNRPTFISEASVFGGGGAVNSGLYQRLPEKVLSVWLKHFNIKMHEWIEAQEFIETKFNIRKKIQESDNSLIRHLGENLKWNVHQIDTWQQNNKQNSVFEVFSQVLQENEVYYKFSSEVKKIKIKPKGYEIITNNDVFTCDSLILSAGAIQTPQILINSSLIKKKSCNFNFHASWQIGAEFSKYMKYQKSGIDSFQAWDPDFNCKIGGAVSGPDFEEIFRRRYNLNTNSNSNENQLSVIYASIPSEGHGGFLKLCNKFYPYFIYSRKFLSQKKKIDSIILSGLKELSPEKVWQTEKFTGFTSVHLYGSVSKLSGFVPGADPVKFQNLYVIDNSIIPSAPLANPQGPLMILSHILAQRAFASTIQ